MAQIIGQIESLKRLKQELNQQGITRFNSVGSIRRFTKNHASEIQAIYREAELKLNNELESLQKASLDYQEQYHQAKKQVKERTRTKLSTLNEKLSRLKSKDSRSIGSRILIWLQLNILSFKIGRLERQFERIVDRQRNPLWQKAQATNRHIAQLSSNRNSIIAERCKDQFQALAHTKQVVDNINPLIAGAIGENLVVKELKKLPDTYIVINDYSTTFNPPIYNRKENDKIFRIQVDHLVISPAGVFVLETKNWSKKSMQNLDLRSPIQQVRRTSYALFCMLNGETNHGSPNLRDHHWGKKKIPVRNVVVMIKEKPKEPFRHVTIKRLNELLSYIEYYERVFSHAEVKTISDYLMVNR